MLCCVSLAAAAGPYARDWVRYPSIVERPAPPTLFAIGDIHGDYERALRLIIAAHIIPGVPATPEAALWSAGTATLVVTGDMIDKGPRPVDVLHFLIALRKDAPRHGGEVILLAGNHEAEFLATPDQKKAVEFNADLRRTGISASEVVACRGELGEFLCSLPFGARVGDWFFSHGAGASGLTLKQLSAAIEKGVGESGFAAKELVGPNSLLEARLTDAKRESLSRGAAALGVNHVVQGHQPRAVRFSDGVERAPGEMFQRWGIVFLIDTGMSREVGDSQGAALRLADGRAVAICPSGAETVLWTAASPSDTGRAAACPTPQ